MKDDREFSSWEDAVHWLKQQPDQAQLVSDCYYDDPLIEAANRYWQSPEWQEVRQLLAGYSGKALDVGAGRGIASYALSKDGFSVTSLEPDPSELVGTGAIRHLVRELGVPISIVEQFSERLPFADNEFDVVFARAVLHHTRDLDAACKEFSRVLKPGGLFLAIREHVISAIDDLPHFLERHPLHRLYGGENAFLLSSYISSLEKAGLVSPNVLSPWHSPINFAPNSVEDLQRELSNRASLGIPQLNTFLNKLIGLPFAWSLICLILSWFDNRPGRLYSFVVVKS